MAAKIEKNQLLGYLVTILAVDIVLLVFAGWGLNEYFNGPFDQANEVSPTLVLLALVAGMVVVASVAAGFLHYSHYGAESLSGASSLAILAWCLLLLTFGVACKGIDIGGEGKKVKVIESFVISLTIFQTIYVVVLHAGVFNSKYGVGFKT